MEKIRFQSPDGTVEDFYIEEQTRIGGVAYLLVSDSMDDEANAYILKDVSEDTDSEACYEMVEDYNYAIGILQYIKFLSRCLRT